MLNDSTVRNHVLAAEREERAAVRATCQASSGIHAALAELHRQEAERARSVQQVLRLAFGD